MKLAVSILNYKTPDLTLKSIDATIEALREIEESQWQIIVVDNHSQDGSEQILRKEAKEKMAEGAFGWQNVIILQSGKNGGFGAGNNFAINYARKVFTNLSYIYILNSDAFPDATAIQRLVDFLDDNPKYGFAGSYIYGTDGVPHETAFRFPSVLGEFEGAIRFGPISKLLKKYQVPMPIPTASCDVDWLAGASMLMRIKALEQVGIFDETFFLYFEETDLCLRAKRMGWPTRYVLESKVAHVGSASTGMKKWERIPQYWLDSRKHYFQKNHGSVSFFLATVLRFVGGGLYALRCKLEKKTNPDPKHFLADMISHAVSGKSTKTARG